MPRIQIYTTRWCGYCERAKALLDARGVAYEEVALDGSGDSADALRALTGSWTTPQVVVDGTPVGGYRELRRLDRIGRLAALAPAAA